MPYANFRSTILSSVVSKAVIVALGATTVHLSVADTVAAQEVIPADNGLYSYHTAPRYRESESHPLRVLAYIVHPIGWVAREVIFRPLSYFASSTETTRSVMGYREPYDYRQPECFSADDSVPDCRAVMPFNYDQIPSVDTTGSLSGSEKAVYFPDVNFDFDSRKLNDLGRSKVRSISQTLQKGGAVKVVLQGHTDFKGSDEYNMKLGVDRAEAVRAELVALGVAADRLSTVTFGESQPLFAEQEDWARAANRRVETHYDEGGTAPAPVKE
jgi:outer membrane protein OmpA-like peptidoglycan-associated protein